MKRLLLFIAAIGCCPSVCNADLLFVFSEAGDGGVIVTASGTGTMLAAQSNTDTFGPFTISGDIIADSAGAGPFGAGSFTGTNDFISNNAGSEKTTSASTFTLTNSGASDALEFTTANKITFNNGSDYSLDFTAVFAESVLDYDNLNIGNFSVDLGGYGGFGNANITFSAVPEPTTLASMGLMGLVGAGLAWRKRRKAKNEIVDSESQPDVSA